MKNKIIEEATKLFSTLGYAGSSTAIIAKKCNISQPLIHYHFRTKNDLWEHCFAFAALHDNKQAINKMVMLEIIAQSERFEKIKKTCLIDISEITKLYEAMI